MTSNKNKQQNYCNNGTIVYNALHQHFLLSLIKKMIYKEWNGLLQPYKKNGYNICHKHFTWFLHLVEETQRRSLLTVYHITLWTGSLLHCLIIRFHCPQPTVDVFQSPESCGEEVLQYYSLNSQIVETPFPRSRKTTANAHQC